MTNLQPELEPENTPPARTETAERVIAHARRILKQREMGYADSPERLKWARDILGAEA